MDREDEFEGPEYISQYFSLLYAVALDSKTFSLLLTPPR